MNSKRLGFILTTTALSIAMSSAFAAPRNASSAPGIAGGPPLACAAPTNRILDRLSLRVFGLTADGRLVCFRDRTPQIASSIGFVTGLVTDTSLVGIDFRVQNGLLYGVGNAGGVYTINTTTAAATLVNRLSVAQSGTRFGVDFNPAADRLRVTSDNGQNLRHNVNDGATIADSVLNYTVGTPAASVIGAAYTNNDLDANTATTLFDLDTAMDQVVVQSPANAGTLAPTGKLTVDAQAAVGMDIYSTVRNGVTVDNEALAVLAPVGGTPQLYDIELTTGKATLRGTFAGENAVVDIAIPLGQR